MLKKINQRNQKYVKHTHLFVLLMHQEHLFHSQIQEAIPPLFFNPVTYCKSESLHESFSLFPNTYHHVNQLRGSGNPMEPIHNILS